MGRPAGHPKVLHETESSAAGWWCPVQYGPVSIMLCMVQTVRRMDILGNGWAHRLHGLESHSHGDICVGEVSQDVALVVLDSLPQLQEAGLGLQEIHRNSSTDVPFSTFAGPP